MINYIKYCRENNIVIDRVELFSNYALVYSEDGIFLIKKNNVDVKKIFNYFKSINFDYFIFPTIVKDNYEIYKYYPEYLFDKYGKAKELINVLIELHTKSFSYTEYSDVEKANIYNIYKEKIDNCFTYYLNLQDSIEEMNIIMPSYYLILNNISKFYKLLRFAKYYLEEFYNDDNNHYREAFLVENTSLSNFWFSEKKNFIDLDESKRDLLIFDFVNFYNENYNDIDIISLFNYYNSKVQLNSLELNLFFMFISIPTIIEFTNSDFANVLKVRDAICYVDKALNFISEKNKEDQE